jgi:O-antigen ligase
MATRVAATVGRVRLDILFAQACLGTFMVYGFGALSLGPRAYAALMAFFGLAVFVLAPRRNVAPIKPSAPILLLLARCLLSFFLATSAWSWVVATGRTVPAALALITIAALVPFERAVPALPAGCYVAMGSTLLALLVNPAAAITNPDGSVGWRGSFDHRNLLALFLVIALPTIMAFERRRSWKVVGLAFGVGLLIMSRSVTGLVALLTMASACAWFWTYRRMMERKAAVFATTSVALGTVALALSIMFMPALLPLVGKDLTFTGRTKIWKQVWSAIQARPLQGYGVGVWLERWRAPVGPINRAIGFRAHHAHNGLLELLFQLGAIGTGLYLAFVLETMVGAWHRFRQRPDVNGWTMLLGVVIVTTSVSEPPVLGPWLALLAYAQTASKTTARQQTAPGR